MRRSNPAIAGSFSLNLHVVLAALLTLTLAACGHKNSAAPSPPTITSQPQSVTVNAGANATFAVTADGHGVALTYQWQKNATPIAGATAASYTTPATATGDNGSSFTVVVTAAALSVTSNAAVLTVQPAGSLSGVATASDSGAALAETTISVAGISATSDANGEFSLVAIPPGSRLVVTFKHTGYAPTQVIAAVNANAVAIANARLTPVAATQSFDAAAGATVTVLGSPAQVILPDNGFVTASGGAPSGQVTADITPINPLKNPANMPGDYFTADTAGNLVKIESFGALNVTLYDATGAAINLASGKTATLRIPLATHAAAPPATVPLFYFNESTGLWVSEGTATLAGSAPAQYYEGVVSHFTTWNSDQVETSINVSGCVRDSTGNPTPNALVEGDGADYSGYSTTFTDAAGNFVLTVKQNAATNIYASVYVTTPGLSSINELISNPTVLNAGASDATLSACLVLPADTGLGAPPVIVSQPTAQSISAGGFAFLSVSAIGAPPVTIQWQKNGVNVAGAIGEILYFFDVSVADQGSYQAIATNPFGSTVSAAVVVTVAATPPTFVTQPSNATVNAGATATFTVTADAAGSPLTYQWQRNGANISGATGASYTTPAAVVSDNGATFRVIVTANGLSTTSAAATLSVVAPATPVSIITQPVSVSVPLGAAASFSVAASGTAPFTYQWRRNGASIAGATSSTYTTAATTAADNGALFSVVVTNSVGSVTSTYAALTVTTSSSGGGVYLASPAGPAVSWTLTYADGPSQQNSQALIAVPPSGMGGATTIEAAGTTDSGLFQPSFQATVTGTVASNLHERILSYFKSDGFYSVDLQTATQAPSSHLTSSLKPGEVCAPLDSSTGDDSVPEEVSGNDFLDATKSWVFFRVPGADAVCETDDDQYRAVRLDMAATATAVTIGEPLVGVLNGSGGFAGLVVRSGNNIQQLDATLVHSTSLFSVAGGSVTTSGVVFGSTAPGIWVYESDTGIYGVKLSLTAAAQTPVLLATLASGESLGESVSDGANGYLAIQGATSTRIIVVNESALAVTPVATLNASVDGLNITPSRLVASITAAGVSSVVSLPKSGGAPTTLVPDPSPYSLSDVLVSGENVYYSQSQTSAGNDGTLNFSNRTGIVKSDGTNAVLMPNVSIVGSTLNATVTLNAGISYNPYALFFATGLTGVGNDAGGTLQAIEGATRNVLETYGQLPATPTGVVFALGPEQYGEAGLFDFLYSDGTSLGSSNLYWFNSGTAGSLLRQTQFN